MDKRKISNCLLELLMGRSVYDNGDLFNVITITNFTIEEKEGSLDIAISLTEDKSND